MTHIRTLIRRSVIERLRAEVPSVGGRVHPEARSSDAFQDHDVPAILVELSETEPRIETKTRPRIVRRSVAITVEIVGGSFDTETVDDALDAVSVKVEAALADPDFLPLVAHEWRLSGVSPGTHAGGEMLRSVLRLTYACSVASTEGRPDTHR